MTKQERRQEIREAEKTLIRNERIWEDLAEALNSEEDKEEREVLESEIVQIVKTYEQLENHLSTLNFKFISEFNEKP